MKAGEIRIGETYRSWSLLHSKWWYRTVLSISRARDDPHKTDITYIKHYGQRTHGGQWPQETTRLASFACWAQERVELPEELKT